MEAKFADLTERDQAAKREGKLEDRYIQEQIADGYAYYRITEVMGDMVRVEHMNDIADGYTVPMIESMGCVIPLKYAEENIARRDAWSEIFKR